MCGIVGIIRMDGGDLTLQARDLFENLLYHDTVRGPDSTGAFVFSDENKVHIIKDSTPGYEFIKSDQWKKLMVKVPNARAMFGHNRYATVGDITHANAHPFLSENIILMHNGTLHNKHTLGHTKDVDSDALCHAMSELGWKKAIDKASGSWALSWFDLKESSINVLRNTQRPLHMGITTIQGKVHHVFASEKNMLHWVIDRTNATTPKIEELEPDERNSYSYYKNGWVISKDKIEPSWMHYNGRNSYEHLIPQVPPVVTRRESRHPLRGNVTTYYPSHKVKASVPDPTDAWGKIGKIVYFIWLAFDRYSTKTASTAGKLEGYRVNLNNAPIPIDEREYIVLKHNVNEELAKTVLDETTIFSGVVTRLSRGKADKAYVIDDMKVVSTHKFDAANDYVVLSSKAEYPMHCSSCKKSIPKDKQHAAMNHDTSLILCEECAPIDIEATEYGYLMDVYGGGYVS